MKLVPQTEHCINCKFYRPADRKAPADGGGCHFGPPQVLPLGMRPGILGGPPTPMTMAFWPGVGKDPDDWCGQYKRKLDA